MGLTVLQVVLMLFVDHSLSIFDAVTLSFTTLSTGGFTTHTNSLDEYLNLPALVIVTLFMILGAVSFFSILLPSEWQTV